MVRRARRLAPEELIDLVPLLKQRDPALNLVSFYGGAMEQDVWHSKRLNGVRGACTFPINGETSHDVLSSMIASGIFDKLFRRLSQGESIGKSLQLAIQQRRGKGTTPFETTSKLAVVTRAQHAEKNGRAPKTIILRRQTPWFRL